ncbi:MAG: outer membrane protein assembly factor BamD [Gemmatimonadota bacterium]|jgi:outer membrane protein assembly factor BamD
MSTFARRITVLAFAALSLASCRSADPYRGLSDEQLYQLALQEYQDHDWDHVVRAVDRFFITFGGSERAPDARLLAANAYFAKGDYLTAQSEYQRFLDRYPGNGHAAEAALGKCKCLDELSPVPERDQSYTQDGIATCRNVVVDYSGSPEAVEAAKIANELRVKLAEKEYLNADFYFRRKLYDSAIIYYQFVVQLYSDTDYAPKALLGIYESNKAIGYDDLAEDARQKLLDQYPDSPAAAQVRTDDDSGS